MSGVTYFPVLFATSAVAEHIPRPYQTALIYASLFAVVSLGLAYFIRGLLAAKRHGVPSTFSGWRYALVVIGFGVFLVSSIPTAFSIFSSPAGGGASGVPLGLGLIFS
ncbi:MAG: hypothetical protein K2X64_07880, partial [Rhodocyclaceae bacterium]|nr:hypothetical protein [Rhodocyclaceae bacterium]